MNAYHFVLTCSVEGKCILGVRNETTSVSDLGLLHARARLKADVWAQVKVASPGQQVQQAPSDLEQIKLMLDRQAASLNEYREELKKQNEIKNGFWTLYGVPLLAPLVTLISAVGGWAITYTVLMRTFRQQEAVRFAEQKRQDALQSDDRRHSDGARIETFLVDSLKYFEEGIQRRNIGISLIEAYWNDFPRLQPVWASVLINQAVFILSKVAPGVMLPSHEANNLQRICAVLTNASLTSSQIASLAAPLTSAALTVNTWPAELGALASELGRLIDKLEAGGRMPAV